MKTSGMTGNKDLMGILSIVLSAAGCALGLFIRIGGNGISPGQIVTFVAMILSLMSVKDKGKNVLAKAAFFLSFAALFLVAGLGAIK